MALKGKMAAFLEKCFHADQLSALPLPTHGLRRATLGKESLLPVVANDLQPGA